MYHLSDQVLSCLSLFNRLSLSSVQLRRAHKRMLRVNKRLLPFDLEYNFDVVVDFNLKEEQWEGLYESLILFTDKIGLFNKLP